MRDQSNNPYFNAKVQKIINKLISEEWYAGNTYKLYTTAICPCCKECINELMNEMADDELNDHMASLIQWADTYGYNVPTSMKDFQKYAGEVAQKEFDKIKKDQDVEYYLKKTLELENDAVKSYQEALDQLTTSEELLEYGDLIALLQRIILEEYEHYDNVNVRLYVNSISVRIEE